MDLLFNIKNNTMIEEIWKDVIGYEGVYKVSSLGNVMSMPREWISANGCKRFHYGMILKTKSKDRYHRITLCKNGVIKHKNVHTLMAESFLNYDSNSKLVVDHINNISKDNRLENLQIISTRQNLTKDKVKKSNLPTGVSELPSGRFRAAFRIKCKKIHIGVFNCPTKASFEYLKAIQ